jgi:hypothetical protein
VTIGHMEPEPATKAGYDEIIASQTSFWGDRDLLALHHPIFLYEFGDCALVVRDDRGVAASLFGLVRVEAELAYVHLVCHDPWLTLNRDWIAWSRFRSSVSAEAAADFHWWACQPMSANRASPACRSALRTQIAWRKTLPESVPTAAVTRLGSWMAGPISRTAEVDRAAIDERFRG